MDAKCLWHGVKAQLFVLATPIMEKLLELNILISYSKMLSPSCIIDGFNRMFDISIGVHFIALISEQDKHKISRNHVRNMVCLKLNLGINSSKHQ